jgi:hypothetical protein
MSLRRGVSATSCLVALSTSFALGAEPPSASTLRAAFEAQFPKSDANGTALELEGLSAGIGIDLAPRAPVDPNKPDEPAPPPKDGRARPEPGTENRLPLIEFLQRELSVTNEKIGKASPVVEKFFEEREAEISEIESYLLSHEEPRWEVDVQARMDAPIPNLLGNIRLQRVLLTRALLLARGGNPNGAIETMEASWRLQSALLVRPDLISHLIAIAVARFQAGVLRKIDSPALGWSERLRSPSAGVAGYEAALQNQIWFHSREAEADPDFQTYRHAWERFIELVERRSPCSWSEAVFGDAWEEATPDADEDHRIIFGIATPNLNNGLLRARLLAVDAELTALILDARGERAALRHPRWPAKLLTLGSGVCPEAKWSYRALPDGTARFRFESRLEGNEGIPYRLPLEFIAGTPLKRRPAKKGVVVNPPPPVTH